MGLLNNIKDRFNKAEFSVAPNKKLKTISASFKENFELSLVFYKGKKIADGGLTLKGLNDATSSDIATNANANLKIKGSMLVGDVEDEFMRCYGVTVQVKDAAGKKLVPNEVSLGKAARGEY